MKEKVRVEPSLNPSYIPVAEFTQNYSCDHMLTVQILVSARQTDLEVETALSLTPLDLATQSFRRSSQPQIFHVLTRELERRAEKQLG